jgi:dephospho-CoA kinase
LPAFAITGGVASGKSTFTKLLAAATGAQALDADDAVRGLLDNDPQVAGELREQFGPGIFLESGKVDRPALRQRIFASEPERRRLEAILHPRVRTRWRGWIEEQLQISPRALLLVQIPLLYETGADAFFAGVIVVGCGSQTQVRRLTGDRGFTEDAARRMIASQWETPEKIRRGSHVIWNDGALACLEAQANLCARLL